MRLPQERCVSFRVSSLITSRGAGADGYGADVCRSGLKEASLAKPVNGAAWPTAAACLFCRTPKYRLLMRRLQQLAIIWRYNAAATPGGFDGAYNAAVRCRRPQAPLRHRRRAQ